MDPRAVAALALGQGLSTDDAVIAVAVAKAESGYDPQAVNHNTNGTTDRGLWQINDVWTDTLVKAGTITHAEDLFTATTNARAMALIHRTSGWQPWSSDPAISAGAYRTEAADAVKHHTSKSGGYGITVPGVGSVGAGGSPTDLVPGLSGLIDAANSASRFASLLVDPRTWLRVAEVLAGLTLVVIGVVIIDRDLIASTAGTVARDAALAA
jgi:hypothetical protein